MNKTHLIQSARGQSGHVTWITTKCGRVGYPDRANEFDTANGDKFEAYTDIRKVTCRRCNPEAK